MTLATLDKAIAEAERFIGAARDAKRLGGVRTAHDGSKWVECGQHAAAAKRASMDLTRALADLRR